MKTDRDLFRLLPAVGRLLDDPRLSAAVELYGRDSTRVQARRALDDLRSAIEAEDGSETDAGIRAAEVERRAAELPARIAEALENGPGRRLRRVINATGIFVHTNLGRSPLPRPVLDEIAPLLVGYCDLKLDLDSGERSERNRRAASLLRALCGAEGALVANNNAGALVLALAALAAGRGVVVSRGELVEIGGSFRVPEILEAAGARLVEVGTTNRTRIDDYRRALERSATRSSTNADGAPEIAMLLKVHPSNYRIEGFTAEVEPAELAELGREAGVPVMVDEGSGLLRPNERPQWRDHASLAELIDAGVDLVSGSGDKVLGGPQAGLLLGRADLVERCRRHPLYRALRPDGFTFAALEAVLRRHLAGEPMPIDRLYAEGPDGSALRERLQRLVDRLAALDPPVEAVIVEADGFIGGGSAPGRGIPGPVLALAPGSDALFETLRRGAGDAPPLVGYARDGRLFLDLRTVEEDDDDAVFQALTLALSGAHEDER